MRMGALIMAGGRGERFWPASRRDRPKQLLSFGMDQPLIVQTAKRVEPFIPFRQHLVITSIPLVGAIAELLPQLESHQIVGEPAGRNTAPCIGIAAVWMLHYLGEDCVMAVLSADHYIAKPEVFISVLQKGAQAAAEGRLVTIGLKPSRPETGYGYLELGRPVNKSQGLFEVRRFLEKPDPATAERFVSGGRHRWNGGMFLWSCQRIRDELQRHLPALTEPLAEYEKAVGTPREREVLERIYPQFPDVSIDYAVMEKADGVVTVTADIGWDDLGNWTVLERLLKPDAQGNRTTGPFAGVDTRNCIISADGGLVATLGVEDLVIVKQGEVVLVMPKDRAAELKQLTGHIKKDKRWEKFL